MSMNRGHTKATYFMKVQDIPEQRGRTSPDMATVGDAFELSEKELSAPWEWDRQNVTPSLAPSGDTVRKLGRTVIFTLSHMRS